MREWNRQSQWVAIFLKKDAFSYGDFLFVYTTSFSQAKKHMQWMSSYRIVIHPKCSSQEPLDTLRNNAIEII